MFTRPSVAVVLTAVLLSAAAQPAHAQLDQVFLGKGIPNRGTIVEMGRDQIMLDMKPTPKPFPVNEIVRVTFANEPSELNSARNAIMQRNYGSALLELRKLEGMEPERDLIRQDIEFYKALALAKTAQSEGAEKVAAAATAMLNFVKAAPQNFHFYEAAAVLGDLAMSAGNYADAARYYGPIAGAPWADYQMRANYSIGRALAGDKQYEQALAKFEAVIAVEAATPEATKQKLLATVGKANCLCETGKVADAISLLQEIIQKNETQDAAVLGRTYNALGTCHLKMNQPKEALLAFLHTDLMYTSDADAHAEALYRLTKLWDEVNKHERATAARSTLSERYAGTIWATLQ